MTHYIANGVLTGLHYHKVGQYRSLEGVTGIGLGLLVVVIIVCLLCTGDGGQEGAHPLFCVTTPRLGKACGGPSSPFDFPIGYIGPARIVRGHDSAFTPQGLPESMFDNSPAPGVFVSFHPVDTATGPLSTDSDFGLPGRPPLWRSVLRRLPSGINREGIDLVQPPQVILANPAWPPRVWLVGDTATVEGLLTFHAHGLLSFELISETHPGLGFAAAVHEAICQSTCFPSVDKLGNRITVSCRYRCLFVQGAQSSVSVGPSVTAIIKKD